ncbi:putative manganese-dependent inorganic pyrophosphatase [compost metagenome]
MVSQICVMDPSQIHSRMEELHQAMAQRLTLDSLDGYVLMLTDLAKGSSELHFASGGILPAEPVQLAGALSRKKEGLPWLTQQLSKVPR